ncbi:MAG: tetratricopeptide repeat protein [Acidobacteriota bacterium]|nr:tetratricopeptide repeat protein [Acidobacteriota bacterium]
MFDSTPGVIAHPRRHRPRILVFFLLVVCFAPAACGGLQWEDYMEAAYHARQDGRYREAEELLLVAADHAAAFPANDLRRAMTLNDLAEICVAEQRHAEAEVLYRQATEVIETALGPDHPDLAAHLATVGAFYAEQGIYSEAEPRYERAVAILERALDWTHPDVAALLASLASVYYRQGLHAEAEPLYERSLAVLELALEPDNVRLAEILEEYAGLLRATNRGAEAGPLEARARRIRAAP